MLNQAEPQPECRTRGSDEDGRGQAAACRTGLDSSWQRGRGGWFVNEIKTIVTQFKRGSSSRFFLQISQVIGAHVAKQRVAPQQPFRREARLCELGQAAKR